MARKSGRTGYRILRSLSDLTLTLVVFELALCLLLYLLMPYIGQHGGSMYGIAMPESFQIAGTPFFQIHALRFGAYLSAFPFYIGVSMIFLSLLTLGASFFSLRPNLITLSMFGFVAIAFSGYSWVLSNILGGAIYFALTLAGLVFALIAYAGVLWMTLHSPPPSLR